MIAPNLRLRENLAQQHSYLGLYMTVFKGGSKENAPKSSRKFSKQALVATTSEQINHFRRWQRLQTQHLKKIPTEKSTHQAPLIR